MLLSIAVGLRAEASYRMVIGLTLSLNSAYKGNAN